MLKKKKFNIKRKTKTKKFSYKKKKNFNAPKIVAWETSGRYANHMGSKFSLSNKQVKNNHSKHYRRALKDKNFLTDLIKEYL